MRSFKLILVVSFAALIITPASARRGPSHHPHQAKLATKFDLATSVAGLYTGDVTSDVKGASHNGVTIQVTRVNSKLVEIRSDYQRLPTVRIPIEMAGGAVVNASGQNSFLIESNRDPTRLDLSIDGASLIVHRK